MIPIILHIPHASTLVPSECAGDFLLARDGWARHLLASTDHFTDELFAFSVPGLQQVTFPISRLVVDPERFEDDLAEPMATRGLGVLYERGHNGERIRCAMPPERRQWYLDRWYRPHHEALGSAVDRAVDASGIALIIDCHSYPDTPFAVDSDQSVPRPDGCLGTSGVHTPGWLVEAGIRFAAEHGWNLGVDRPYSGSVVPTRQLGKDGRVLSIMIEVNRNRYMRVAGGVAVKTEGFEKTRAFVLGLIHVLREAVHAYHAAQAGAGHGA